MKYYVAPNAIEAPIETSPNSGNTVPFRSIRPVTCHRACGLALILVNVTHHIDFSRMWEMVQKKNQKSWCLFTKKIYQKWMKNSFVTGHIASGPNVEMRPLCHLSHPWPNRSKWYSIFASIHNQSSPTFDVTKQTDSMYVRTILK